MLALLVRHFINNRNSLPKMEMNYIQWFMCEVLPQSLSSNLVYVWRNIQTFFCYAFHCFFPMLNGKMEHVVSFNRILLTIMWFADTHLLVLITWIMKIWLLVELRWLKKRRCSFDSGMPAKPREKLLKSAVKRLTH